MTELADAEPPFRSSEALVRSLLGRRLILGGEHALMRAARKWLSENDCPRRPSANDRGPYLVSAELSERFRLECWPRIKYLAR